MIGNPDAASECEGAPRLLVLGGTELARRLVAALRTAFPSAKIILSLAGRTRSPVLPDCDVRTGGFDGAEGLAAYLKAESISALIDATHPYAAGISANAAKACRTAEVPCLHLVRSAWEEMPGDRWLLVADGAAAARQLEELAQGAGRRVFLGIGRQELAPYRQLGKCSFIVRSVEPPEETDLPDGAKLVLARGPFSDADELAFLREEGVEILVSKNSGGTATYGKIAAARALGLPVVMIERPALPDGERAETPEDAVAWLSRQLP